jgi:hypothetical protein
LFRLRCTLRAANSAGHKGGVTEAEKNQDIIDCHAGYREDFGDNRPTYDALARQDARHAKVSETGFIEAQDAGRTNA